MLQASVFSVDAKSIRVVVEDSNGELVDAASLSCKSEAQAAKALLYTQTALIDFNAGLCKKTIKAKDLLKSKSN